MEFLEPKQQLQATTRQNQKFGDYSSDSNNRTHTIIFFKENSGPYDLIRDPMIIIFGIL